MRNVTIYRWSRGSIRSTDHGRRHEWLVRETLFCSRRCLETESRTAFGEETVARTRPDGTVILARDDIEDATASNPGTIRHIMTFEPVTLLVEDDVADVLDEVLEDTRTLIWGPSEDGARIRLELHEFALTITVHEDATADVRVTRKETEHDRDDA